MADVPPGVKGMNDILPPEVSKWQFLEEKARGVLEAHAYRELRTPVLEYTPLFVRSVGEVTDVVEKQMYTFDDRDGRSVSLRPEGTASAVRAYIEQSQWNKEPVTRWYYLGPMFRHERAQRGRLRQFHQVGAELFGVAEPSIDAEMIAMLVTMLVDFGLPAGAVDVTINSLGEPEERAAYRDALVTYFSARRDKLDDDSRRRLETNPLRILDSKNPDVIALAAEAPVLLDSLGEGSRAAAATTGWLGRWEGRQCRRSGSRWASSARCWPSPNRRRATSPPSASSSPRWTKPRSATCSRTRRSCAPRTSVARSSTGQPA